MNMQNVSNLVIPEGEVKAIHDKNSRLLWGRLSYDTKYAGDAYQQTYSGKNIVFRFKTALANLTEYYIINAKVSQTMTLSLKSNTSVSGATIYIRPTSTASAINVGTISLVSGQISSAAIELSQDQLDAIHNGSNGFFQLYKAGAGFDAITLSEIQLESGSSPTSYEPYTGGAPAPNPDYPQPIQVVTGEQTVTVSDGVNSQDYPISLTGKNLVDYATATANTRLDSTGATIAGNGLSTSDFIEVKPSTEYTRSNAAVSSSYYGNICQYNSSKMMVGTRSYISNTSTSNTFTTEPDAKYIRISHASSVFGTSLQIEEGSSPTTYAPYYNYELCKIDAYQDYIYKSGNDWYAHKETGKFMVGDVSKSWSVVSATVSTDYYYIYTTGYDNIDNATNLLGLSDKFIRVNAIGANTEVSSDSYSFFEKDSAVSNHLRFLIKQNRISSATSSAVNTFFSNNPAIFYYALATPTDTQITDATLVDQLNVVHQWLTRYGYNATATGNLPIIINKTDL